jgi:enoyl-CoA hydratase
LTGERVGTADALALGLATHAVASAAFGDLRQALIAGEPVDEALARFAMDPGPASLAGEREMIQAWFSAPDELAILSRLDDAAARGAAFAGKAAATMRQKSPTSLVIALEQMRRGGALEFEEAMRTEFRIVSRIIEGPDFYEGVRAAIIDKDGAPRWRPATLEEVDPDAILRHYFAGLGPAELELP